MWKGNRKCGCQNRINKIIEKRNERERKAWKDNVGLFFKSRTCSFLEYFFCHETQETRCIEVWIVNRNRVLKLFNIKNFIRFLKVELILSLMNYHVLYRKIVSTSKFKPFIRVVWKTEKLCPFSRFVGGRYSKISKT